MAVTADDLWTHLSGGTPTTAPPERVGDLERVLGTAVAAITPHLTGDAGTWNPDQLAALDTATLRAASELWRWQQSSTGEYGYADGFDVPVGGYRDVFYTVQPLLAHAGLVNPAVVA